MKKHGTEAGSDGHQVEEDFSIEPEMFRISRWFQPITPRKINMEPENEGLEDAFSNFQH